MNNKILNLNGFEPFVYSNNYLINIEKGLIIHAKNKKILGKINQNSTGKEYIQISIIINNKRVTKFLHRMIYEHVNGSIPKDKIIDHIDGNSLNNSINNLQCITQKENINRVKKSLDQSKMKNKHHIKSTNIKTNEIKYYGSISQCSIDLNINPGMIKMVCEKYKGVTQAKSRNNDEIFIFEYIDKKDIPINTEIQYGKIGPKFKNYICDLCNKEYTNNKKSNLPVEC